MAEDRPWVREKIVGPSKAPAPQDHQANVDGFSLTLAYVDGRKTETLPWHTYGGHDWTDKRTYEEIIILFSARMVRIRGQNLEGLDKQLGAGRRMQIAQHNAPQIKERLASEVKKEIIEGIESVPSMESMFNALKEE